MELKLKDYVKDYIQNEIDYIKSNEDLNNDYNLRDLFDLMNMSDDDIQKIVNKIENDDELINKKNKGVIIWKM